MNRYRDCDYVRRRAISLLFVNNQNLISLLFNEDFSRLNAAPKDVLGWAGGLSGGEQSLVKLALDIWSDEGGATLSDMMRLDLVRFEGLLLALECLRFSSENRRLGSSAN